MKEITNWEKHMSQLLKSELKLKGVTYAELAEKLAKIGVDENQANIGNKLQRGRFSVVFFAQCLFVIGSDRLRLD